MEDNIKTGLIDILKPYKNNGKYIANIIALNCSGILLGCKPASTITFRCQNPQKDTLSLWNIHKNEIFDKSTLKYLELYEGFSHTLVLIYDKLKLNALFENWEIKTFLSSLGYNMDSPVEDILLQLKRRFTDSLPHETGIFVGLPLKDVMGFMGMNSLKLSCCKGWNIYGSTGSSLNILNHYNRCRDSIIKMLVDNNDPFEILKSYPVNTIDSSPS